MIYLQQVACAKHPSNTSYSYHQHLKLSTHTPSFCTFLFSWNKFCFNSFSNVLLCSPSLHTTWYPLNQFLKYSVYGAFFYPFQVINFINFPQFRPGQCSNLFTFYDINVVIFSVTLLWLAAILWQPLNFGFLSKGFSLRSCTQFSVVILQDSDQHSVQVHMWKHGKQGAFQYLTMPPHISG